MPYLSNLDMSEYHEINNKISDTASFNDIRRTILSPLSRLIGAETSVFALLKKDDFGVHAHNFISNNIHDESTLNYEKNFQRNDPVLPHAFHSAKRNYKLGLSKSFTFSLDNIIDFTQFSRGDFYNEFLRPYSIRQIMATGIPSSTDSSLVYVLGFHRYCNSPFKKEDAQISSYFGPALFNILNNLELKTQLCDHNIISAYFEKQISDTGLIILDNNQNVVFANHAGQSHLQVKQTEANDYSGLENELMVILRTYLSHLHQSTTNIIEFDYKGVKIAVRMNIPDMKHQDKRIILNTHRPSTTNISHLEIEKFHLTQREIDISGLIVMGMTSPQISEKLCISIRTVENHLRSIFLKTGVKNRTTLAYKLSPPPPH